MAYQSSKGNLIDRFRDRIILPIRNESGQVLAFIGRAPDDRDSDTPKYLNTPSTPIYRKGERLFGVGVTPLRDRRVVLVEGPFDVLAVHAVVPAVAAVAPCGTSLTAAQAQLLGRAGVLDLVVAFDADQAGAIATLKAYDTLRPHIERPLVARLPAGTDPAALAETRPADLARTLTDSERLAPLLDHVIDDLIETWRDRLHHPEGRVLLLGALLPSSSVSRGTTWPARPLAPPG